MDDTELIYTFNKHMDNTCRTSNRTIYMTALREELDGRMFDFSDLEIRGRMPFFGKLR